MADPEIASETGSSTNLPKVNAYENNESMEKVNDKGRNRMSQCSFKKNLREKWTEDGHNKRKLEMQVEMKMI